MDNRTESWHKMKANRRCCLGKKGRGEIVMVCFCDKINRLNRAANVIVRVSRFGKLSVPLSLFGPSKTAGSNGFCGHHRKPPTKEAIKKLCSQFE